MIISHQYYNEKDDIPFKSKATTSATGNLVKEFTREDAPELLLPEKLPVGPFAGGYPRTAPVDGTTVFGMVAPGPPDSIGEGAGANNEFGPTTVGGAISGGKSCGPVSYLATSTDNLSTDSSRVVFGSHMCVCV